MDDERRWNSAPQYEKTVEDSNVPPSYAHYHMHQGTTTQNSGTSDKRVTPGKQKPRNRLGTTIGLAVVFGLVAGIVFQGVNLAAGFITDTTQTDTVQEQIDTAQLVTEASADSGTGQEDTAATGTAGSVASVARAAMPTVVAITSVSIQEIPYYFGFGFSSRSTQQYSSEGSGSGIIVGENDDELLIATNNHVVSGATTLSVCFMGDDVVSAEQEAAETASDSTGDVNVEDAVSAKIKGTDETNDLAVIAVAKSDIPADTLSSIKIAQLDTSDDLDVGEQVVAIGNALGYGQSVTSGWISALNRTISTDDTTGSGLIQTDAAINPGNSGGALCTADGKVIGINSAKIAKAGVEGMGFAIPINQVKAIVSQLISNGHVTRPYLGLYGIDKTLAARNGISWDHNGGIYVYKIADGSPLDGSDIVRGDYIMQINGKATNSLSELRNVMMNYKPGDKVTITYEHSGHTRTAVVVLGEDDGK